MMRPLRLCLIAACLSMLCGAATRANAQSFKCGNITSKLIASPQVIYLRCSSGWPTAWASKVVQGELWEVNLNDPRRPAKTAATVNVEPESETFIKVTVTPGLTGGKKYILALKLVDPPKQLGPAAPAVGDIADPDLFVEISTAPATASITQQTTAKDVGSEFVVRSPIAVQTSPEQTAEGKTVYRASDQILYERRQKGGSEIEHEAEITGKPTSLQAGDPDLVGTVNVQLPKSRALRQAKADLQLKELKDVFGQSVTANSSVTIAAPAPKGKDDATQYYQLSHIAARGSRPSYAINIKTKALPLLLGDYYAGDFLVQPNIVVDIGTNDLGKKTDNTMQFGVTFNKKACCREPGAFFQGIQFGPGAAYETNRGFKKNNLLVTFDSNPILRDFIQPREERRRRLAAAEKKATIDEIDPDRAKFGFGLEFFFGLEAGGSPTDQEFKNKAKTATLNVPSYAIFRFRPRTHAFVEYGRLTLDVSQTLRLLATPEYVGEELPDTSVRLRRVAGMQFYTEVTASFGLDASKHMSFAVTYKRGAQPPSYPHVNTVQSGFVLKY